MNNPTQEEYQERRERWAAALESGDYAQSQNALRDQSGFCCLGVACDLYSKEVGGEWERLPEDSEYEYEFMDISEQMPARVMRWLGLNDSCGEYHTDGANKTLAELNDTGSTFTEIAAIIRAAPEGLFDDA